MQNPLFTRLSCSQGVLCCGWAITAVGGLWAGPTSFLSASSGGSLLLFLCAMSGLSAAMHCGWGHSLPGYLQLLTTTGLSLSGRACLQANAGTEQWGSWRVSKLASVSDWLGWGRAGRVSSICPFLLWRAFPNTPPPPACFWLASLPNFSLCVGSQRDQ